MKQHELLSPSYNIKKLSRAYEIFVSRFFFCHFLKLQMDHQSLTELYKCLENKVKGQELTIKILNQKLKRLMILSVRRKTKEQKRT